MAKTEAPTATTDEFEGIELDTFTPEPVAGKYDRHVQAMLKADEKLKADKPDQYEKGERTRVKILTTEDDSEKTVRQFQDSARKFDRTGRHIGTIPQGDGGVALQFVLGTRQSRPRKAKPEATPDDPKSLLGQIADADGGADVPDEVTDAAEQAETDTPEAAQAA